MSLEDAGNDARSHKDRLQGPKSKCDFLIRELPEEDSKALERWLRDPVGWSSHMISKALDKYSRAEGKDFPCGHSTIDRWRILNGIKHES